MDTKDEVKEKLELLYDNSRNYHRQVILYLSIIVFILGIIAFKI